jgi:acyl-CoA thioesterase FadM
MVVWLRGILVWISSSFRSPIRVLDQSVRSFRVWPNDFDLLRHLNNGRYLTLMDLGRFDLIIRMGLFRHLLKRRWYPVVGSATIRYLRSIYAFQKFEMRSRIVCWDEKWFFVEQRFEREGRLMAVGLIKGLILGPEGKIPPYEVLRLVGFDGPSPAMPPQIAQWMASEEPAAVSGNGNG